MPPCSSRNSRTAPLNTPAWRGAVRDISASSTAATRSFSATGSPRDAISSATVAGIVAVIAHLLKNTLAHCV